MNLKSQLEEEAKSLALKLYEYNTAVSKITARLKEIESAFGTINALEAENGAVQNGDS